MKYLLFIAIILTGLTISACAGRSSNKSKGAAIGHFSDFDVYFGALIDSKNEDAFLIVSISDTEDFFQFKYYHSEGVLEIDFPLITERQQSLEERVKSAHQSLGLDYEIVEGSDGSRFLDVHKKLNAREIPDIITSLYEHVYLSHTDTKLSFRWSGFELPKPAGG